MPTSQNHVFARERAEVRKALIAIGWPTALEQLMGLLTQMVDMAFVGRVGAYAVAAVGMVTQPLWLSFGIFGSLGIGVIALVARFKGAGDEAGIARVVTTAFWLALGLALLVGGLLFFWAPAIVKAMGAEPDVLPYGVQYLRILAPGLIGYFWYMVMASALRAVGETKVPMQIIALANVLNAVLDWLLVPGTFGLPALGVAGAAWATTAARLLATALLAVVLFRREGPVSLSWQRLFSWSTDLARRVLLVAGPAALERVLSATALIFYSMLVNRLGTVATATQQTAYVIEDTIWLLAFGLSTSTATLVGQSLGAGRVDRAELALREALKLGGLVILTAAASFALFPGAWYRLFNTDAAVIALGVSIMPFVALTDVPMGFTMVLQGALQGAGDTKPLFIITLIGCWAVRLSLVYLFLEVLGVGLVGAWFAAIADWLVRITLSWWRYKKGVWKQIAV